MSMLDINFDSTKPAPVSTATLGIKQDGNPDGGQSLQRNKQYAMYVHHPATRPRYIAT